MLVLALGVGGARVARGGVDGARSHRASGGARQGWRERAGLRASAGEGRPRRARPADLGPVAEWSFNPQKARGRALSGTRPPTEPRRGGSLSRDPAPDSDAPGLGQPVEGGAAGPPATSAPRGWDA